MRLCIRQVLIAKVTNAIYRTTEQSTFVTEILGLHTIYEKMLTATSTIPRPNQLNIPVLEYADLVAETIGLVPWSPRELKGFVDVCVGRYLKLYMLDDSQG